MSQFSLLNLFGCFLKWWVFPPISHPKMIIFNRKNPWLLGKPTILGNPHLFLKNHHENNMLLDFYWLLESSPAAWVGVCCYRCWSGGIVDDMQHFIFDHVESEGFGVHGGLGSMMLFLRKLLNSSIFLLTKKIQVLPTPKSWKFQIKHVCVFLYMIQNLLSISEPFFFQCYTLLLLCNPRFVGLNSAYRCSMTPDGFHPVGDVGRLTPWDLQFENNNVFGSLKTHWL